MAINVYIYFNGNCREALEFYSNAFETERPKIMTYGEAPPTPGFTVPEEARNLVIHAELNISGSSVMFSDNFPGTPYMVGNNISLTVISKNMDKIKSSFEKLKEGGTVNMELQETFWSKCYGSVTDKFGISWQLSYENS
jgi:PhnB protein